jgi:hypothetical protein
MSLSLVTKSRVTRQLEILALRSLDLADRAASGELPFVAAVDLAYECAVAAGLVEAIGDDVIQMTLSAAFANARSPK